MDDRSLLDEIDSAFPHTKMPATVTRQAPRFIESREIDEDIEEFRFLPITVQAIRAIHLYLPVLSVEAMHWLLPHYLRFCISEEGKRYSRKETASLLCFLGPKPEDVDDTRIILSSLMNEQRICLIHFLAWCRSDNFWADMLDYIDNALILLGDK